MRGFRDFLMRGNLLEVAVAFIIGAAFGTVTSSFTQLVMDIIAQIIGGQPNFDAVTVAGVNVGHFITALISFILTAAVVYFAIVKPSQVIRDRLKKEQPAAPAAATSEELLAEIRDLLKEQTPG
ncbi:MAG TPA: large conductance mechanosensitive channel protein MscL [Propionibacteriaceae bacterium]|nr:large conductance mechanosensitive channel protein MscL [Propionibacteriaceae bacterium]